MSNKNDNDWLIITLFVCGFGLYGFAAWLEHDEKKSAAMQHYQVCECLKSAEASK